VVDRLSLASHIQELRDLATKHPQTSMLELAMLNVLDELAQQVADLSMELGRHAAKHAAGKPPQSNT
jgi:hypothetical protein